MSTLQHTLQPALRNRLTLIVLLAGAVAALTITLILANGNAVPSSAAPVSPQQQLEAVAGPRYGLAGPALSVKSQTTTPERQLQAVAGARYGQPVGIHARR
jgi:hypothetical protein